MSFVINEPYRARSGPGMVASGSPGPDRARFELTVGPRNTGRKPTVGKSSNRGYGRFEEGQDLSLFAVGEGLYDPPASGQQLPKARAGPEPVAAPVSSDGGK